MWVWAKKDTEAPKLGAIVCVPAQYSEKCFVVEFETPALLVSTHHCSSCMEEGVWGAKAGARYFCTPGPQYHLIMPQMLPPHITLFKRDALVFPPGKMYVRSKFQFYIFSQWYGEVPQVREQDGGLNAELCWHLENTVLFLRGKGFRALEYEIYEYFFPFKKQLVRPF